MRFSPELYRRALSFAAVAHGDQKTAHGFPYVVHLSMVAMELTSALRAEPTRDEDLAVCCALLHDVLEDTAVAPSELGHQFGGRVLSGVQALTKNVKLPRDAQMEDCLERIQQQPEEIWMVKLSDRIANLGPPPASWTKMKIAGYRSESEKILRALGPASPFLAERLRKIIETYPAPASAPAAI